MSVTSWLTAANASGELSLSHWEIDAIFPSMRETRESLGAVGAPGGVSRWRCSAETRHAWGASIEATTAVARVHRDFIDLTRPGEGFEIMYHFI
jgi:hypothetical protein